MDEFGEPERDNAPLIVVGVAMVALIGMVAIGTSLMGSAEPPDEVTTNEGPADEPVQAQGVEPAPAPKQPAAAPEPSTLIVVPEEVASPVPPAPPKDLPGCLYCCGFKQVFCPACGARPSDKLAKIDPCLLCKGCQGRRLVPCRGCYGKEVARRPTNAGLLRFLQVAALGWRSSRHVRDRVRIYKGFANDPAIKEAWEAGQLLKVASRAHEICRAILARAVRDYYNSDEYKRLLKRSKREDRRASGH